MIKKRLKKKGISQQTATVLLVALVVAIIILVILWGKKYIEEKAQKEGKLAEKQLECENIDLEIINTYRKAYDVYSVIRNNKDMKIGKFTFQIVGFEEVEPKEPKSQDDSRELKELEIKEFSATFTEDELDKLKNLNIIPWLKVARGYYVPCTKKTIVSKVIDIS